MCEKEKNCYACSASSIIKSFSRDVNWEYYTILIPDVNKQICVLRNLDLVIHTHEISH